MKVRRWESHYLKTRGIRRGRRVGTKLFSRHTYMCTRIIDHVNRLKWQWVWHVDRRLNDIYIRRWSRLTRDNVNKIMVDHRWIRTGQLSCTILVWVFQDRFFLPTLWQNAKTFNLFKTSTQASLLSRWRKKRVLSLTFVISELIQLSIRD